MRSTAQPWEADALAAYARLLSLVRFFHPSDQVATADWNQVAVAGVRAVEGTRDPESLAGALESFFRPLAPTLRVIPKRGRWSVPSELRPPAGPAGIVAWRHYGGDFGADKRIFSSERIDNRNPGSFGSLAQAIPAEPWRGRRIRLVAWIRADVEGDGRVQLGLRVDRPNGQPGFFDNMADRPIRDSPWRRVQIEGDVAPDAERILVILVLTGSGEAWLDEVSITAAAGSPVSGDLDNGAFDQGETGRQPPGWMFPYEAIRAGYHLALERGEACRKGGCARIVGDAIAAPKFVQPENALEVDLGAGAVAFLPVSLYADERGTLPHVPPAAFPAAEVSADTRETRLAAVALAWGLLQHFHPSLDREDPAWPAGLRSAFSAASEERETFLRAVYRMLIPLRDPFAGFSRPDRPLQLSLPLTWEWIEGRLIVTGIAGQIEGLRIGSIVKTLGGRAVDEVLREEEALVSGATPEARRWWTLEILRFGPPGSNVEIGLESGAKINLTRETPYEKVPAGTPLAVVAEPRTGIFYVDLGRIEEEKFYELVPRLAAARGVIFDLRLGSNLGAVPLYHLADRTLHTPPLQVPVVMSPDSRGVEWLTTYRTIEPKAPRFRRAAFLVDGRSDGYSETVLAMVEAFHLGEIVGARSGGNNGGRNRSDLPGGYRLSWTGQRALKHDGSPLHGVGFAPTVPAARTLQGIAEGRDEIVEAAAEALQKK